MILCVSFLAILTSANSFAQSQNVSFPFANGASVGQQAVEKQIGKEVLKKGTQAWAGKKIMNYATEVCLFLLKKIFTAIIISLI